MRLGVMQGRLSPLVDGRIQAFPAEHWEKEFVVAGSIGIPFIEWTLDQSGLMANPFITDAGRERIRELSETHGVYVPSVTGDFVMHAPFFREQGDARFARIEELNIVLGACDDLAVSFFVMPLVDASAIESDEDEDAICEEMRRVAGRHDVTVVFESDFPPEKLAKFIARLPDCGVNYDIGNSAALGFDPVEEIEAYGSKILNVHVKDRPRNGTTVPLGKGNADFVTVFSALSKIDYAGRFVLQTARAEDGDHIAAIQDYRSATLNWLQSASDQP